MMMVLHTAGTTPTRLYVLVDEHFGIRTPPIQGGMLGDGKGDIMSPIYQDGRGNQYHHGTGLSGRRCGDRTNTFTACRTLHPATVDGC